MPFGAFVRLGLGRFSASDDSTASLVISVRTGFEPCNSFYFAVLRTPFDI